MRFYTTTVKTLGKIEIQGFSRCAFSLRFGAVRCGSVRFIPNRTAPLDFASNKTALDRTVGFPEIVIHTHRIAPTITTEPHRSILTKLHQ